MSARSTLADHDVELLSISGELTNSTATSPLERLRVGREDRAPKYLASAGLVQTLSVDPCKREKQEVDVRRVRKTHPLPGVPLATPRAL